MKKILMIGVLLSGLIANTYSQTESPELLYASGGFAYHFTDEVSGTGTIMLKGDTWIIRVIDREGTTDYFAANLDDKFKVEGLMVNFAGTLEEVPENVRMVGKPIKLSKIEAVASEKN